MHPTNIEVPTLLKPDKSKNWNESTQCVVEHSHMVKTILYGICMGYYLYGICIGNCGNFFPWNRSNAATSHTSPIQKANFSWTLKPYISAPASRRMMPLVPNESTTQDLSFEPPLTPAEGRWKVEISILKCGRNAHLLSDFPAKYCQLQNWYKVTCLWRSISDVKTR